MCFFFWEGHPEGGVWSKFLQGRWFVERKTQRKAVRYWIYQVAMPGKKMELGCKAIKEAGADAIPSLIKALQKKDSVLKRIYISVWWQLPALPQRILPRPVKAVRIREVAAMALGDLGSAARVAVPALTRASQDEGFAVRIFAAEALVAINRQTAEHESKALGGKDDPKLWTNYHPERYSPIFGSSDAFGNSYSDHVSIGGVVFPVHLRVVGESAGLPQTDVMKWVRGKQAMHSRALVG